MELRGELHRGGATIVMVTHDRRFTHFAGRTIELLDGALTNVDALETVPAPLAS